MNMISLTASRAAFLVSLFTVAVSMLTAEPKQGDLQKLAGDEGIRGRAVKQKFARRWDEKTATLQVKVDNPNGQPLQLLGVQSSANLYVVSYPPRIAPNSSDNIVLRYLARAGATGDRDVVRLLTSEGEREIEVIQEREQAFVLTQNSVTWPVGADATVKTVTLTLQQANLQVSAVRILGNQLNEAKIQQLAGGLYGLEIKPASTAAPNDFAVLIELTPEVPGSIPVIQCRVVAER